MKKIKKISIFAIILTLAISFCTLFGGNSSSIFCTKINSVLAEDIAEIDDFADLKEFMTNVNSNGVTYYGKTVELTNDIVIDTGFSSIGKSLARSFKGHFNGNGYSIYGLTVPLFGHVSGGSIKNVIIENYTNEDRTQTVTISATSQYVGAVIGRTYNSTSIYRCINFAQVENTYSTESNIYTGGIVGYMNGGSISECANRGSVSNTSDKVKSSYVGGIVGKVENGGRINNCYVYSSSGVNITANAKETDKTSKFSISHRYGPLSTVVSEWVTKQVTREEKEWIQVQEEYEELVDDPNASWWDKLKGWVKKTWKKFTRWVWKEVITRVTDTITECVERNVGIEQYIATPIGDKCTKTIYKKEAYAYGIGYSAQAPTNVYVANVTTSGGYSANTTYDFKLQFWANNSFTGFVKMWGAKFTKQLVFENADYQGPISQKAGSNCYYFQTPDYSKDRNIYYEGTQLYGNTKSVDSKHSVGGTFRDQVLRVYNDNDDKVPTVYMKVAESITDIFSTAKTFNFDSSLLEYKGTSCSGSMTVLRGKSIFNNSSVWDWDYTINNGFPYLSFRYWQNV